MPVIIIAIIIALLFFYKRKKSFNAPKILVNTIERIKVSGNTITGILYITIQNNNNFDLKIDSGKIYTYSKGYKIGEFNINPTVIKQKSDKEVSIPIKLNISTTLITLLNSLAEKKLTLNIEGYIVANGIKIPFTDKYNII